MGIASKTEIKHPISSHGVIGDMRTLALVSDDGTITFFCHPNIDSPSLFASIVDAEKGGFFRFAAKSEHERPNTKQMYLPDTNILITRFLDESGIGEVCDFMPVDGTGRIIRRAKAITSGVHFELDLTPRPDYGTSEFEIEAIEDGFRIRWDGDESPISAYCSFDVTIEDGRVRANVALDEGKNAYIVLCPDREGSPPVDEDYVKRAFRETRDYWHKWVNRGKYPTFWRELVTRSALTLKLLTSAENGSIAAAGTFGLPEVPGGERNWDYRYCWVRDSAFTLYSLSRLGYYDEAESFIHFLMERAVEDGASDLQIMYGMDGRSSLEETTLDHFCGYADSTPVRIGNGAFTQLQLDIYGEFMDAVYISTKARGKPAYSVWIKLARMMDWVCENWRRKDKGIWESRGEPQEYLSSRLMCWVALDRALRMAFDESLPANVEEWRRERDTIQKSILEEFWNPEIGAFTQFKGSTTLDAVVLLMPLVKFINPRDPMWTSTLKAVKRELVHDCLVYRYKNSEENDDGLDGKEGAFTICSFWYVEALARTGYVAEARLLFEKLHTYANHLGLYSEELSSAGDHLGNFPQALTHLSLISAAIWLDRALNGDRQDPHHFEFNMLEDPDGLF